MNFKQILDEKVKQTEKIIVNYLPEETGYQKTVIEAINYSFKSGGKRLRPLFMKSFYELFGGNGKEIEYFMAAIEMIHTYSLIHDDLPAMDNDDYRRGRKTTHVVYGEAMGILAGDGLLNLAFETAAAAFNDTDNPYRVGKAIQILGNKSGIYGMLGGQCVDVESEGTKISEEKLEFIHLNKTAALLEASMSIGALLAGADDEQLEIVLSVARNVGMAFQIQDDILDVTSTTEELGKPVGSDEKNHKTTFVTLLGIEGAGKEVERISENAMSNLKKLNKDSEFISELIASLINRKK